MTNKHYAVDLGGGDFVSNRKNTIDSMNLSTALIKENRNKIYSKVFYSFSLIFAVLIAVFSNYLNWTMVLLFIDITLIFLVFCAKEYYKERRILSKQHYKIIDRLNEFGIKINKM
ncbi:MAG: hypothetical protein OQK82_06965 [Candidatus Pacearchaeota archaeon]|nr:hypothetical protein [Candidatus Pacearchaeota archaeon]